MNIKKTIKKIRKCVVRYLIKKKLDVRVIFSKLLELELKKN